MGNESAVEASVEAVSKSPVTVMTSTLRWLMLLPPLMVFSMGVTGFVEYSSAGWPIEFTASWLGTALAAASWGYTYWLGFLRRKPEPAE